MEILSTASEEVQTKNYNLNFKGEGGDYFGILLVNWILTIITFGFYYPWAKEKKLKYLYGSTEFNNLPFAFHGTGKEMFRGFIKAILIFAAIYAIFFALLTLNKPVLAVIGFYLGFLCLIPLAIHGSYRYRMSRTSWSGIRFGYRGDRSELIKMFVRNTFLTIITIGIYGAWMTINLRNYILSNIRFGNLKFKYKGSGSDYFFMNLKGYILTILTLGIYIFRWQKNLFEYYINNLSIQNEVTGEEIRFKSTASGFGFAGIMIINFLLIVFTFGIGYAWVVTRTLNFVFNNIQMEGTVDLHHLVQTESNYTDATGEDIGDLLDFGFVI